MSTDPIEAVWAFGESVTVSMEADFGSGSRRYQYLLPIERLLAAEEAGVFEIFEGMRRCRSRTCHSSSAPGRSESAARLTPSFEVCFWPELGAVRCTIRE